MSFKSPPALSLHSPHSHRKYADLHSSSAVTLTYLNQTDMSCVSLTGTCHQVSPRHSPCPALTAVCITSCSPLPSAIRLLMCSPPVSLLLKVPYPQSTLHWRDWLYMFYPEGSDESAGSRFTTWKITPTRVTVLSFSDGVHSSRHDGRPPELMKTDEAGWVMVCDGREDGGCDM